MIHIRKETLRFMKCQSCLTDRDLNDIKIQYPNSANYQSITLCGNCIQHLVNLYQKDKHSYIADTKENGVIWHDLRKNPDDLPKEFDMIKKAFGIYPEEKYIHTVFNQDGERVHCLRGNWYYFYDEDTVGDSPKADVIAWCEIPKFEVTE